MGANVMSLRLAGIAGVALFGLVACSKFGGLWQDEMGWARAALERNDRIEVVGADPQAKTFTLRLRETGELRMVRVDQIIASPPGLPAVPSASNNPTGAGSAQAGVAGTAGEAAVSGVAGDAAVSGIAGDPAARVAEGGSAFPDGSATAATAGMGGGAGGRTGLPAGGSGMMTRAGEPASAAGVKLSPNAAAGDAEHMMVNGVPDPTTGRVLRAGPGYSIKVGSKATGTAAKSIPNAVAVSGGAAIANAAPIATGGPIDAGAERRHEPIICKGDQMLHIDNRVLEFDGDAISAEDGCELHITNSRIVARGTGVAARGTASVHIANSQIEGGTASIDAADGGQIYAQASTFKGMSRRLDDSAVHDLGGNVWN